jgi:Protein of unknown function (DUF2924)
MNIYRGIPIVRMKRDLHRRAEVPDKCGDRLESLAVMHRVKTANASAPRASWQIIKDFFQENRGTYDVTFRSATQNPLVRDGINCVNAMLCNARDRRSLTISPKCQQLIRVAWKKDANGNEPETWTNLIRCAPTPATLLGTSLHNDSHETRLVDESPLVPISDFEASLRPGERAVSDLLFGPHRSVHGHMVNSSGELLRRTDTGVSREIQQLKAMTIPQLRARYREVFGSDVNVLHKPYLIRRIAWQLQARVHGGLSDRARNRIAELADGGEIGPPSRAVPKRTPRPTPVPTHESKRDPRLPPVGALLRRRYQGREIVVKVLKDAFECDAERFSSLSALTRKITGTRWNGLLFFGLAGRRHG